MFQKVFSLLPYLLFCNLLCAELSVEQRLEDFEYFWQTYRDAYVFFDLKKKDHGVDWNEAHHIFTQKLAASESDLELYAAITEAQSMLRDGHCYNSSFAKIRETEKVYFQKINFTLAEGNKIIARIVPEDSVFAEKGIKPGYELIRFDGKTIRQLAAEARAYIPASSEGQFWINMTRQLDIYNPMTGKPKSAKAELIFKDFNGKVIMVKAPWLSIPPTGKPEITSGFAGRSVSIEDAILQEVEGPLPIEVRIFEEQNIGYIKIDSWMKTEDPIEQLETVFTKVKDTDALVLDLRNNGGGILAWGILFTNYLIAEEAGAQPNDSWLDRNVSKALIRVYFPQLDEKAIEEIFTNPETMKYVLEKAFGVTMTDEELMKHFIDGEFRGLYSKLILNNRKNKITPYLKPVYALTNGGSYSTTDICLTILSEFKRAKILGTPNGAGGGSPIPFVLPNSGLQVYVPHGRFYPPTGTMIEGRPLKPAIRMTPSAADIAEGHDSVLSDTVNHIMQELNPFSSFTATEVDVDVEPLYSTIKEKNTEWGNIPTPDFAVEALVEQIRRNGLKF
jgi:C-terminal processing protease CtpA/Prc